jgi:hypothetical protein
MTNEITPRTMARLTGLFYLITIVGGVFAQGMVADRLIDFTNANTTATNILGAEGLFRTGFTVYLIEMVAQIITCVLFYYLLKPVSRSGSMLAMIIGVTASIIKTFARVMFLTTPWVLHHGNALTGFSSDQVNSLALTLLRMNDEGAAVALALFGPSTVLLGWLMTKSTFYPKWLGILGVVGGIGWTAFYAPWFGRSIFMPLALIALVGSVATIGWLLIVGVNEEKFREQSTASASSIWR